MAFLACAHCHTLTDAKPTHRIVRRSRTGDTAHFHAAVGAYVVRLIRHS
jgi:hypothetical protein